MKPILADPAEALPEHLTPAAPDTLRMESLSFAYPGGKDILRNVSFSAKPGQIIGITGAVLRQIHPGQGISL